ncbi:MAG: IS110 family transposase, partial [Acidithiobacillus sp.]
WAGKTPIAKTGNALLRKVLFFPAVVAKKYNPLIAAFCNRLLLNGKRPMQAVVAAMRKLLHLAFGVLKSGKPFDPEFKVA